MNDDIQAKLDEIARKRAEIAKLEASLRSRLVTEEAFKACGVPFDPEDTLGLGPISAARPTRHQDDRAKGSHGVTRSCLSTSTGTGRAFVVTQSSPRCRSRSGRRSTDP